MALPRLVIGADHGGWRLAKKLVAALRPVAKISFVTPTFQAGDDYPMVAQQLVAAMRRRPGSLGIGICRSGTGLAIVANKHRGIRAAQVASVRMAKKARLDENANFLSLGADYITASQAVSMARSWMKTSFRPTKRYRRRLRQLARYEARIRN